MQERATEIIQRVLAFIREQELFTPTSRPLLAVSGGRDSMMLLALFHELNLWNFGVAHYNFQLRGAESERDMQYVQQICAQWQIPLHIATTDTKKWCRAHRISTQEGCRMLRYDFFRSLLESEHYTDIVTAHHAEDQVETILFRMLRGGGLKGLRGMLPRNGNLVRPLLFLPRKDIEFYLKERNIAYVDDSSNASDKYTRNFLRHNVLPLLREVNPQAIAHMSAIAQRAGEAYQTLYEESQKLYGDIEQLTPFRWQYDAPQVREHPSLARFWLREKLQRFQFTEDAIHFIINQFPKVQVGRYIASCNWIAFAEREELVVQKQESPKAVEEIPTPFSSTRHLQIVAETINKALTPSECKTFANRGSHIAVLDQEKVLFPLRLRAWKARDSFSPIGMKGKRKKVSDFLTDCHYPTALRRRVQVLVDTNDQILWIPTLRIAELAAISPTTRNVWVVNYNQ